MKPKTRHIGAKVSLEVYSLVDQAAVIKGWPRQRVVAEGAVIRAQQILEEQSRAYAQLRKSMRQVRAQAGGRGKAAMKRGVAKAARRSA